MGTRRRCEAEKSRQSQISTDAALGTAGQSQVMRVHTHTCIRTHLECTHEHMHSHACTLIRMWVHILSHMQQTHACTHTETHMCTQ